MLFQSQGFLLLFLPAVLTLWYMAGRRRKVREWLLIAASTIFYGWAEPRFLLLLIGQAAFAWLLAEIYIKTERRLGFIITAAIALNLCVLIFFKYSVFLVENFSAVFGLQLSKPSVLLPIGISFFTFEIISYLADLRWHGAPRYCFRRFFLFVCFFPRLIAGPIVRHHEIIPQFDLDPCRDGLARRLSLGATLFVLGLAKKVFLADKLAPVADAAFASAAASPPGLATAWSGALAFTFQLFLDFSAYSEMAIGIALMLGITLPQNFNAPYQAVSLSEFWRRWHMTLSRYLRDYVYIPLGGSRHGAPRTIMAVLATMGLCGLWHGAGWTFAVWGLLHGIGLVIQRFWRQSGFVLPRAAAWLMTFLFVIAGWVIFRAPTLEAAGEMLQGMAGLNGSSGSFAGAKWIALGAIVSILGPTTWQVVTQRLKPSPLAALAAAAMAVAAILEVGAGQPKTFIYFQF